MLEEKNIHDEEMGQEIEFEEEEDIKLEEELEETPKIKASRAKFFTVITIVVVVFLLIVGGWIYFFKLNMDKINQDVQSQGATATENVTDRLKDTYDQLKDVITKTKQGVTNVAPGNYTEPQGLDEKLEQLTEEKK